jgi:hypothetical protein
MKRTSLRLSRLTIAFWSLAVVLGIATLGAATTTSTVSTWLWREAPLIQIQPENGSSYLAYTGRPRLSSHAAPSPSVVLENNVPLGPGNALHDTIRQVGRGHYSFWHEHVYFSTPDNTDPRNNGRSYSIRYPLVTQATVTYLRRAAIVTGAVAVLLTAWLAIAWVRAVPRELGLVQRTTRALAAPLTVPLLLGVGAAVFALRTDGMRPLWVQSELTSVTSEEGIAYVAPLGSSEYSSHAGPSAVRLLEDGRPLLGPSDSQHADIRNGGRGRYSFWYDYVIFSTSDNSDPRRNGRRYTVLHPPVSRVSAIAVYVVVGLLLLAALRLRHRRVPVRSSSPPIDPLAT